MNMIILLAILFLAYRHLYYIPSRQVLLNVSKRNGYHVFLIQDYKGNEKEYFTQHGFIWFDSNGNKVGLLKDEWLNSLYTKWEFLNRMNKDD